MNRLSGSALLVLGLLVLVASVPVDARIGNPLKKAKEKLTQKVAPEEEGEIDEGTIVFDDLVLELTDERLDGIVAAFQASKAAGAGRPDAVAKLDKLNDERNKHLDKNEEAIREIQNKRGDVETCYADGYHAAQDRRAQEYAQKALTDEGIRERFTKVAAQHNEAAARGDSVAIKKAQEAVHAEMLATAEDSAAVRASCGPIPPPTPAEIRLEALDKQIAAANEAIRAIDEKIADAQAGTGGMEKDQFAMAAERVQMYLAWKKSHSKQEKSPRGFTKEEIEAMEKHLEKLLASLG